MSYEWLTYGLSYMINESMNHSGLIDGIPQEQVYQAVSDPEININSVLDGTPNITFVKYHANWNANIFVIGNFMVNADTLKIQFRVCNLVNRNCGTPVSVQGPFQDFKSFYFLMTRMMESLYAELIGYDVRLTRAGIASGQDKTRQLAADYEGYKTYIQSWIALRHYDDGVTLSGLKKYDDAIRSFESARALDESSVLNVGSNLSKVYLLRGNQYFTQNKWEEAASDYSKAFQWDPNNSEALYNLGNVYKNKKAYDEAIQYYRKSLELNTVNTEACINIGFVCVEQGKFSDAVAAYEKALSISETNAAVHYYTGVAYDNSGDVPNAVKHYRRAIELDNAQAGAHLNLGIILKQQKDLAGARKEYELAVQFDPNNAAAHRNLGILLMNDKKEAASAAEHLEKCLALDPNQPDASVIKKNIGILKKKSGKKKK